MVPAIISNSFLINSSDLFIVLLGGQLVFYAIAVTGWITQSLKGVLKIPMFFLVLNCAIALASAKYITAKPVVLWTPSQR